MAHKFRLTLVLALLALPAIGVAAPAPADVAFVETALKTVKFGPYMAVGCQPTEAKGWAGFPSQLCRYPTAFGAVPVILLDPDNARLARWLTQACTDAGASYPKHCAERLALRVKCQSGGQFPISGFVEENGQLFLFRDGVTVAIKEFGASTLSHAPSPAEETLALDTGAVLKVYAAARIQGTTRAEYAAFKKIEAGPLGGLAWQGAIREAYQLAWSSDRNDLMSAWAVSNRSLIDHKDIAGAKFDPYCKSVAASWKAWPITGE
jgi:hypothetical protein